MENLADKIEEVKQAIEREEREHKEHCQLCHDFKLSLGKSVICQKQKNLVMIICSLENLALDLETR